MQLLAHDNCLNTPRFLDHSSHPHSLTLLPTPTYSSRTYTCDACGSAGNAFSLCCAQCEFDLHLDCANLPTTVLLEEHPHELKLIFGSPYEDKTTKYGCDLCSEEMLPDNWLYYCPDCDFGMHPDCAMGQAEPKDAEKKTQETKEENPGARSGEDSTRSKSKTAKKKPRNKTKQNQRKPSEEQSDTQESLFEAQRKLRENEIAHKLMLKHLTMLLTTLDHQQNTITTSSNKFPSDSNLSYFRPLILNHWAFATNK